MARERVFAVGERKRDVASATGDRRRRWEFA
jgi:hypothetical protein